MMDARICIANIRNMLVKKRFLSVVVIGLLVTGCAGSLQQFTLADIQQARQIAETSNDTDGATCFSALAAQFRGDDLHAVGLFSTYEKIRVERMRVESMLSTVQTDCKPLSNDLIMLIAKGAMGASGNSGFGSLMSNPALQGGMAGGVMGLLPLILPLLIP